MIINSWPNKKTLGYSLREQLLDMLPSILLSGVMSAAVILIGYNEQPGAMVLMRQVIVGASIYFLGTMLLKPKGFLIIKDTFFRKKRLRF